jgi:hypothetical protein
MEDGEDAGVGPSETRTRGAGDALACRSARARCGHTRMSSLSTLSWLGAARDGDAWGGTHPRRAVSAVGRTAEAEMVMAAIVRAFVRGAREVAAGDARRPSSLGRFFGCGQKNFRVAG